MKVELKKVVSPKLKIVDSVEKKISMIENNVVPKLQIADTNAKKLSELKDMVIILQTTTKHLSGRTNDLSRRAPSMMISLQWQKGEQFLVPHPNSEKKNATPRKE